MKLLTIIGARPQFIKAATVSRAVAARSGIREVIVHTGQHYDTNMSDVFFDELSIPKPNYHLGIGGGGHGQMTGRQLEAIERVLIEERPDWVLVYGDTNSTLAVALAAVKLHIPVAHVEAGLRSFNRRMPEEINRVLTDHAADLLFAPTETAVKNLLNEGIKKEKVSLVGDVMYDASLFYRERARRPESISDLNLESLGFILATIHRAENTDDPIRLQGILDGLAAAEMPVILPLHPRTRSRISEYGISPSQNLHIIDPVGYLEMVWLEANCAVVATDSGGVQKEAYFFRKPCVTLRDETEWVELVEIGANVLVGANREGISAALQATHSAAKSDQIYGTGVSSLAVVSKLIAALTEKF